MSIRRISWGIVAVLLACARLAQAQSRTVAVVYDDSGSMGNAEDPAAPWRYANYAFQTLTGLLAPQDALLVARMSNYATPERIDLSAQPASVVRIRQTAHAAAQQTPYEAVQSAMQALVRTAEQEAAAGRAPSEKWLIIITDGQFVDRPLTADEETWITTEIRDFVQKTGARTLLLMIGNVDQQLLRLWEREAQARRYEAADRAQIAERMRQIAADITQRSLQPLPTQVQGSTATLVSELPLRRVTVLQQWEQAASLAELRQARSGREGLSASAPSEPAMPAASTDPVFARIHHVTGAGADAVIPEGTVRFEFGAPVDAQHLQLLPEVAARLAVWLADEEGRPLPGAGPVHEVCEGTPVRVRATLLSPAGDTLLRLVRRPEELRMEMQAGGQTAALARADTGSWYEHPLAPAAGDVAVSVSAAYPGYFHFRSALLTVRPVECRPRALALLPVRPWRAKVTEIDGAPPVVLAPTADGAPVRPEELARWTLTRLDSTRLKVDIERTATGWTLRPRRTWGLACCTPTGDLPITVELRSPNSREAPVRATVPVQVEDVGFWRKCGWLVLLALLVLLLGWYLIRVLRKRRFCPGSEIVYQRVGRSSSRQFTHGLPGKNPLVRWLVPTRAERRGVEGIVFEPGLRCSYLVLPAKAQTDDMYVAGEKIEDPGRRDVRIANGDALEVRRGDGRRETYTYSLRST
ncbi:MAG TPA: hypothetical protein VFX98_07740 [Longimicrobiaceae bacterium]|nr:hypothetical protein [Longimicrobiaceae bacterium]